MEYRQLGRSGLKVSLHALGTMNFAGAGKFAAVGHVPQTDAARLVDAALAHGVNLIDTADVYSTGRSEEVVGAILKDRSPDVLGGPKVRFAMGDGPNARGLSRHHIVAACEASLRRLQRGHIDIYYLHEWDGLTPVEETMEALDTLVKQGKIRYAACSNFSAWHIMKCLMAAERHNGQRFVCQQIHYTIEAREAECELLPIAIDQGVAAQVWSPLAGGLLSGKFRRNAPPPDISRHLSGWSEPPVRDENRLYDIIDALLQAGEAHGVSAARVALAWLAGRPGVANIVVGARSAAQLEDNLAAASLVLSDDERAVLDRVSLQPLTYPYWHQNWTAGDRLSAADLVLHAPHLAARQNT